MVGQIWKWTRVWAIAVVLAMMAALMMRPAQSADDASILRGQIEALGQGTIQLEPRLYTFTSTVPLPTGIHIRGAGQATRIRAVGDIFAFEVVGSYVAVANLLLEGANPQTTDGGGISFARAGHNVAVDDVTFGHNLGVGLDVAPTGGNNGIYFFRHLRWNGILNNRIGIRIGDGLHHVTDISINGMSGTAATPGDMGVWIQANKDVDTVNIRELTLIQGGTGIQVGPGVAGPSAVTGFSLTDAPAIESMSEYGVLIQSANNVRLSNISLAQNRGGLGIGSGVRGLMLSGSTIHANRGDGITMWSGASGAIIANNLVADNNLSNATWGFGISIGGGVSDFTIANNRIGNSLVWGNSGNQRYCIYLASGASNRYSIKGNSCLGHTYGDAIVDGGSGTRKVVRDNY